VLQNIRTRAGASVRGRAGEGEPCGAEQPSVVYIAGELPATRVVRPHTHKHIRMDVHVRSIHERDDVRVKFEIGRRRRLDGSVGMLSAAGAALPRGNFTSFRLYRAVQRITKHNAH